MPRASLSAAAVAALVTLAILAPAAEAGLARQEWTRFDAAVGGPVLGVEVPTDERTYRFGGARFDVRSGEQQVDVLVLEDSGRRVAARYMFTNSGGEEVASGDFCREAELDVPPTARVLWVMPSSLVHPCPVGGAYGPAVSGVVYAGFSF